MVLADLCRKGTKCRQLTQRGERSTLRWEAHRGTVLLSSLLWPHLK